MQESRDEIFRRLQTTEEGLSDHEAQKRQKIYGKNLLKTKKSSSWLFLIFNQFKSPFILILVATALLSFLLKDRTDSFIILVIVFISSLLGFYQEKGAHDTVTKLLAIVKSPILVIRKSKQRNIFPENIVPGDILLLKAGDTVPADSLLIEEQDVHVDEAILTGESIPVEKNVPLSSPLNNSHLLFMGTSVISGTAKVVVLKIGIQTEFGKISEKVAERIPESAYEKNMRQFGYLLMNLTIGFIVAIFLFNLFLKHPLLDSLLFSLAIAIGFTPQLLPMVITVNLAQGAKRMAAKKVIIKKLASIENFGSMNILCSDKTGTLTKSLMELYASCDYQGKESERAHLYASINAALQTGYPNPIDTALLQKSHPETGKWKKLDEIPYDFIRKRLTILAKNGSPLLISKGEVQSILSICSTVQVSASATADIATVRDQLLAFFSSQSQKGYRILGIAYKPFDKTTLTHQDENQLVFLGFLLFYDPPKPHVAEAIKELAHLGIQFKMITGDNRFISGYIAKTIGIQNEQVVLGKDLENLNEVQLAAICKNNDVFAEISPLQKEKILLSLKKSGNVVGYMGDGINDATAFHAADVGISVDSAASFIKERADIVLLEKNLSILQEGVKEGRKTFANTMKYILMALSANFGNMLSMAGASLFLPFFPLLPKQILLNNLLTDLSEMSISTDHVDPEMKERGWKWDIRWLKKFMLLFGVVSSLFDYLIFGGLIYLFKASATTFRSVWFLESVLSATLIILFIRTPKPFYKSRPSKYLVLTILTIILVTILLPYTKLGKFFNLEPLSSPYFLFVFAILVGYAALVEVTKRFFFKKQTSFFS